MNEQHSDHFKNIAETLDPEQWHIKSVGVAYRTPVVRVQVTISHHPGLVPEAQDWVAAEETMRFAEDLVEAMHGHLSANDLNALILVLGRKLTAWGKKYPASCRLSTAIDTFETLLKEAKAEPSLPPLIHRDRHF